MSQSRLRSLAEGLTAGEAGLAAEQRLRQAWPQLLGPVLAQRTRLLQARRGRLILGCWDPALLSGLRHSAQAAWPELRARIQRMTGLTLQVVQVEPCDPPPPPPAHTRPLDPLEAVLQHYRRRKDPFSPPQD